MNQVLQARGVLTDGSIVSLQSHAGTSGYVRIRRKKGRIVDCNGINNGTQIKFLVHCLHGNMVKFQQSQFPDNWLLFH